MAGVVKYTRDNHGEFPGVRDTHTDTLELSLMPAAEETRPVYLSLLNMMHVNGCFIYFVHILDL